MSKKKGKQMSNLPHSYIDAMEGLQIENELLRDRALKAEQQVKNYDSLHTVSDALSTAMITLDDYLNAGNKQSRTYASDKAKKLYKAYYGKDYINRCDR